MNIFVRFAMQTNNLPNSFMTKAVDDRMLFILFGRGKLILSDREENICENTLCFYPAGESYFPKSSKESPLSFITINFDFSREFKNSKKTFPPVNESKFDTKKILYPGLKHREEVFQKAFVIRDAVYYKEMFLEVANSFNSSNNYGERIASSILQTICYKVLNNKTQVHNQLCLKILNYIHKNYNTITANRDVSEAGNL